MPLTVPNNAPLTGPQRMWLKGFLDGINTAFGTTASGAAATPTTAPPAIPSGVNVTIAFGSQTGNSESLGKKLAKSLSAKGHQPVVKDMADLTPTDLAAIRHLLIITSTYGDGEPPDNAASLHSALHTAEAPTLTDLNYAVFALGDSNYPSFCKCGHDFDQRLAALGAKRLTPIVECDVDFDEPFAAWLRQLDQSLIAA